MTSDWLGEVLHDGPAGAAPAIVTPEATISRSLLGEQVADWQRRLAGLGVVEASTVSVQIAPSVTYVAVVLAALRLGARLLLLHHQMTAAERDRCLGAFRPVAALAAPEHSRLTHFRTAREVTLTRHESPDLDGPGLAVVQFSSGSTGQPKVIQRSEASIRAELAALSGLDDWVRPGDVLLTLNSLVHSFGLFGALLHTLRVGGTVAFAASSRPRDLAHAVAVLEPTLVTGVPAHVELLSTLEPGALPRVRAFVSGGQLIAPPVHQAFTDRHGCPLGQAYGLTEVGLVAADIGGTLAPPAVGWPVAGQRVTVRDGEILVAAPRSPYLSGGDDRWLPSGWLRTGDRGEVSDGVLSVTGRLDALVAIGGLKVDLGEVENQLRGAPGAREAVVVAQGETIEAYVESTETSTEALRTWCHVRLASHKRPRRIIVVARLPRTATGKLVRDPALLREAGRAGR